MASEQPKDHTEGEFPPPFPTVTFEDNAVSVDITHLVHKVPQPWGVRISFPDVLPKPILNHTTGEHVKGKTSVAIISYSPSKTSNVIVQEVFRCTEGAVFPKEMVLIVTTPNKYEVRVDAKGAFGAPCAIFGAWR